MRYPRGGMLITARVSAVGIAEGVPDQNRQIRFVNIFIHDDPVTKFIPAEINEIIPILRIMIDDLITPPVFIENIITENSADLLFCILPVKTV